MERFVCIHRHFHQPLRENPWPEAAAWRGSARAAGDLLWVWGESEPVEVPA